MNFKTRLKIAFKLIFNNTNDLKNLIYPKNNGIIQPENNCPCYDKNGNQIGFWSRSMAVTLCAFIYDKGKWYILASQRGQGTPDPEYRGKWNVITGYLDTNELLGGRNNFNSDSVDSNEADSLSNACCRECFEETGIKIKSENIKFWGYNDNPRRDKRQNVTFRYFIVLDDLKDKYESMFSHDNNEKDEVGEIKFISISEINNYQWAFNHDKLIKDCFKKYEKNYNIN